MAILCSFRSSQLLNIGFHPPILSQFLPISNFTSTRLLFRLKNGLRLRVKQRLAVVLASNTDPSGGDSIKEKSGGVGSGDAGQGPPLLTILAGLSVFLLVCWILGSIVMWLVGLIVNPPPSK